MYFFKKIVRSTNYTINKNEYFIKVTDTLSKHYVLKVFKIFMFEKVETDKQRYILTTMYSNEC